MERTRTVAGDAGKKVWSKPQLVKLGVIGEVAGRFDFAFAQFPFFRS